jgi:hypothetical protein
MIIDSALFARQPYIATPLPNGYSASGMPDLFEINRLFCIPLQAAYTASKIAVGMLQSRKVSIIVIITVGKSPTDKTLKM